MGKTFDEHLDTGIDTDTHIDIDRHAFQNLKALLSSKFIPQLHKQPF